MSLINLVEIVEMSEPRREPLVAECPTCRGPVPVEYGHCADPRCRIDSAYMHRYEQGCDDR